MTNHPRNHALRPRSDEDEAPQSVIHAPPGFAEFVDTIYCFVMNIADIGRLAHAVLHR